MWQDIKRVFKSVRQYKKYALITPIFMVIEAVIECVLPFIMSEFIEKIGLTVTIKDLVPYFIGLILMTCGSIAAGVLGGRYASIASNGFAKNLRDDLYKKIESFSFENIDKFRASSLVTRITTDVNNAQQSFQMCTRIVFRAPLMLIFSTIMAFITGGKIALIFCVAIPVVFVGFFFIIKGAMKIFRRVFKRYDKLNESVQENVTGIRAVKSYVREDFEIQKFSKASNDMSKDFVKAEKIVALNNPLMNTSIHSVYLVTLYFCSTLIFKETTATPITSLGEKKFEFNWGTLSIGDMSALLTYGIQILMSIMMVSMIATMLVMSLESIRRISEVLKEEPTIKDPDNPVKNVKDGSVVFDHVNFKYKASAEKNTLDDICINIKSGEFIGILGGTGSGKTSLVNLISRLYDITSGSLKVGGVEVKDYDIETLRNAVSVVLQKNFLFSGTIRSNMKWGNNDATDNEILKAIELAQIGEALTADKGLDRKVEQGGANFSGGQKQRLCIARAIIKNPKILILDDSTSAVDTKTDKMIRKGLKEELPNMTKIVIAQRISSIEDANQIIILDDGKINAIGNHETLIKTNKIYQEIYNTQNNVGGDK